MPFKIADDPQTDYRELVRTAYNRCAMNYAGTKTYLRPGGGAELDN